MGEEEKQQVCLTVIYLMLQANVVKQVFALYHSLITLIQPWQL